MSRTTNDLIQFEFDSSKYDESNPLVLPTKRDKALSNEVLKKQEVKRKEIVENKVLSKKKRKELERKLAQKEKKLTRAELWKELEACAPPTNESKVTVLPLFNRSKKLAKPKEESIKGVIKGKAWKRSTEKTSESSKSTDEYSTDDNDDEQLENDSLMAQENLCKITLSSESIVKPVTDVSVATTTSTNKEDNESVTKISMKPAQPARFVLVSRTPEVTAARLTLPIIADEASIMEAISENDCVIICGATGCGKTTQVPQFLYEAGYTKDGYLIGITEPRRVAAISMSKRVGTELNMSPRQVSYHIRYEKTVADETEIKFMTDGVLLQEIKQDFELSRYSAVIVDEAHERSIFTDVLLGLISMVLRLRRRRYIENRPTRGRVLSPLKLIIMSATLRVSDFAENRRLFPEIGSGSAPPVIHVESRQFPVTCHFSKITHSDYLKAAFRKVVQIHQNAPSGGILVFLTGQREVLTLCNWLSRAFPVPKVQPTCTTKVTSESPPKKKRRRNSKALADENLAEPSTPSINQSTPETSTVADVVNQMTKINLDNFDIIPTDEETELGSLRRRQRHIDGVPSISSKRLEPDVQSDSDDDNLDECDDDDEIIEQIKSSRDAKCIAPVHALPLYSLLSPERQQLVFESPPEGHRLIVVATNVAETSLTIPNIRFVVDSGKVKTKIYDPATGASSFEIVWISQASAEQRAGRAGRVAPGHCYRLYSSQVFSSMRPFATPDILTRPIDEVVLMLKSYLGSTPLSRFPLPTSPSPVAVDSAECRLVALGALEELATDPSGIALRTITRAGRWMARLPLPARFARMLLFADQHQLMPYAVVLVAVLSVPDLYLPQTSERSEGTQADDNPDNTQSKNPSKSASSPLEQFRTNFTQQFVRRKADLLLGDLAVLLGTVCCLERYAAQLNGLVPAEPGILEFCGGQKQISRDPDAALRLLTERCGVRWNAYKEIRQLRRQLIDILNANIPDLGLSLDPVLPRPTPAQVDQLRQLFLVGSPCHLATKFDVPVEGLPAKDRRRLRYAYRVPGVPGPVFVDPSSPLARENYPYLAFLELHTSAKPFLRTVCAIDPRWIPFLAPQNYRVENPMLSESAVDSSSESNQVDLGDPSSPKRSEVPQNDESDAEDSESRTESTPGNQLPVTRRVVAQPPSPRYDPQYDLIVTGAKRVEYVGRGLTTTSANTGDDAFELPNTVTLIPLNGVAAARSLGPQEARLWSTRWFARYLLQGQVFSEFADWFPQRIKKNVQPSLLTVSWGLVRTEVRKLVSALTQHNVDSRRALLAQWKVEPQYLSNELASWLPSNSVAEFHSRWPLVPLPTKSDQESGLSIE